MLYKIFRRFPVFIVNQRFCIVECPKIGKMNFIRQPEIIARHFGGDVHDCLPDGYFNFLDFIQKKHTQFLVEPIQHHHLHERCSLLVQMFMLGRFQERVHVSGQSVVTDAFQIVFGFLLIADFQPSGTKKLHQFWRSRIRFYKMSFGHICMSIKKTPRAFEHRWEAWRELTSAKVRK